MQVFNGQICEGQNSNLLNILYQLAKFEAASYKMFRDIFTTSVKCQNLQRAITKKTNFFSIIIM